MTYYGKRNAQPLFPDARKAHELAYNEWLRELRSISVPRDEPFDYRAFQARMDSLRAKLAVAEAAENELYMEALDEGLFDDVIE